jgi:hypothetical protein
MALGGLFEVDCLKCGRRVVAKRSLAPTLSGFVKSCPGW